MLVNLRLILPTIPKFGLSAVVLVLTSSDVVLAQIESTQEAVGRRGEGRLMTPVNQRVAPVGKQIDLSGLRPQGLSLSPDGKLLLVSGKTAEIVVIDPILGTIKQRVGLPGNVIGAPVEPDKEGALVLGTFGGNSVTQA